MKIRTDFVTNSSSSSFIISYKTLATVDKLTQHYKNMLERDSVHIQSISELDKYFLEHYGWGDETLENLLEEEYLKEIYYKYKHRIQKNYKIYFKEVDYSDDFSYSLLNSLHDGINYIIERED